MASFNQNIVRHEHDGDFDLIYTVSNSGTVLGASNFCAVWILLDTDTVTGSSNIEKLGYSVSQNSSNFDVTNDSANCSASGATNLGTQTRDIAVTLSNSQVIVPFTYSIFSDIADGSYYHELILTKKSSGVCYQCQSQVVATGLLTVEESLFTNKSYR